MQKLNFATILNVNDEETRIKVSPDMITEGSYELQVPGATLFYRVRGKGPLLLILAGGHGDADTTDALCDQLINHYTVLTYDRRGLSRSKFDVSTGLPVIATHSDDVHRLLAALTVQPTFVFGSSIGALIGLDLVIRHPEQVGLLVVHEPPVWELLPGIERDSAIQSLENIVETFQREGSRPAMIKFAKFAAVDQTDREPDMSFSPQTPQIEANMNFFFTNDTIGVNNFRLNTTALLSTGVCVMPVGGVTSRESLMHRCTEVLAVKLGKTLIEFPGSHMGWLLRPKEFAAKLLEVLEIKDYE
jgi:pimeloyl-ACP methyl ester carboxylesterase